ncbi:carbohydrate kinase family protein [Evansella clarkii]|uniref:carbohydrate kinase family protein n=1 Tax=Evansella clarkii TaxID=79879 RepID=UPI000B43AC5D|nr:carbohydrate kinase family protein [Evansella clarkii]
MKEGIAIAGMIAVDEIKRVEQYPNRSELSTIKSVKRSIGGAVSNCSVALARIDGELPIEVVTLVGDDDRGEFLKEQLGKFANIDLSQLKVTGQTPFTDVIQDKETRTFFTFSGNSGSFTEDTIEFDNLNAKILHIGYILLLNYLDQEDETYGTKMAKLLKRAQDAGVKTSIDIVSETSDRYLKIVPPSLKYTNYCIINEIEAGKSTGVPLRDESGRLITENMKTALYKLKGYGVEDWVVIHAPEGSFGFDGENLLSVPSLFIDNSLIKGTVGAGDAYASGTLYGALKGLTLVEAMKLGTAAAATSLFEEDSTSGIKSYEELRALPKAFSYREKIII